MGISNFFSSSNWILWVVVSLIVNVFYFQTRQKSIGEPAFYKIEGDAEQYVGSAEELFKSGEFRFGSVPRESAFATKENRKAVDYAFRTPGFAVIYLPLRLLLSQDLTLKSIIILQIILSAVSKYLLCVILLKLTGSWRLFYSCFLLINISPYPVLFNSFLLTESLAFSLLIIGIYLWFWQNRVGNLNLLLIGICFFEVFWLRPFMGILFPLFMLILIFEDKKIVWHKLILFVFPLLLFQTIWVYRNYAVTGKIIPISATLAWNQVSNKVYLKAFSLTQFVGGNTEFWKEDSPLFWLINNPSDTVVPDIFYSRLSIPNTEITKLAAAKQFFHTSINKTNSLSERMKAEIAGERILEKLISDQKNIDPLKGNLRKTGYYFRMLLNQPILRYFVSIKYPLNIAFTSIEYLYTRMVFYFGIFCSIFYLIKFVLKPREGGLRIFVISFIPVFLFLLFSFMALNEFREVFLAFPFLLIVSLYFLFRPMKWNLNYVIFIIFCTAGMIKNYEYIIGSFKF